MGENKRVISAASCSHKTFWYLIDAFPSLFCHYQSSIYQLQDPSNHQWMTQLSSIQSSVNKSINHPLNQIIINKSADTHFSFRNNKTKQNILKDQLILYDTQRISEQFINKLSYSLDWTIITKPTILFSLLAHVDWILQTPFCLLNPL